MLVRIACLTFAALCLSACQPAQPPAKSPAPAPPPVVVPNAAASPGPCPSPIGTWRIASYQFEDGVVAVSDDEAKALVGQSVQITAEDYSFGAERCRIKSIDGDTNDGVTASTAPILYTYDCADDQVLPSIAMDTTCKVRSAGLDGAWYILE